MSDTTTPKKRGRPRTGTAMSSTERSRLMRARVEQIFAIAFRPGRPLEPFKDSLLLLAFEQSYRRGYEAYVEAIGRELFVRVGASVDATVKDTVEATENDSALFDLLTDVRAENARLRAENEELRAELAAIMEHESVEVASVGAGRESIQLPPTAKVESRVRGRGEGIPCSSASCIATGVAPPQVSG